MPAVALKKENKNEITVVKKMKDYSKETVFKKKTEKSVAFLKEHGLPKTFTKEEKIILKRTYT